MEKYILSVVCYGCCSFVYQLLLSFIQIWAVMLLNINKYFFYYYVIFGYLLLTLHVEISGVHVCGVENILLRT